MIDFAGAVVLAPSSLCCVRCGHRYNADSSIIWHDLGQGRALCNPCHDQWQTEGGAATAWPEGLSIGGDTDGGTPDVYQG